MLHRSWYGDLEVKFHSTLIWANDKMLALLCYNGPTMLGANFFSSPTSFVQCTTVMTFDLGTGLIVLCAYALTTGQTEYDYYTLLQACRATRLYMDASSVIVDFEKALCPQSNTSSPTHNSMAAISTCRAFLACVVGSAEVGRFWC